MTTPLRERMTEDMRLRDLSPRATAIYTHLTDRTLDRFSRALSELSEGF